MFKKIVTIVLTFFFLFGSNTDAEAASKKSKTKTKRLDSKVVTNKSGKKIKSKKSKSKKYAKYKRKKGGSSIDLRALTTESPYTENNDNGINSIETKPGIQ